MELETGDVVLCTVDKIVGTIVFVKIDGTNLEGNIITSEIAPGRIRNLRNYVVPKKKIVCKVLRITGDRINLSLRRVTPKEQKEVKEQHKRENSYKSILKSVLGSRYEEIVKEISKHDGVYELLEEAKENPETLKKLVGKADSEKILNILKTQKQKKAVIKKQINLKTTEPDGLSLIKNLLTKIKDAEIKYISAGKYSIKTEANDIKTADNKLKEILIDLEKKAKQQGLEFAHPEK